MTPHADRLTGGWSTLKPRKTTHQSNRQNVRCHARKKRRGSMVKAQKFNTTQEMCSRRCVSDGKRGWEEPKQAANQGAHYLHGLDSSSWKPETETLVGKPHLKRLDYPLSNRTVGFRLRAHLGYGLLLQVRARAHRHRRKAAHVALQTLLHPASGHRRRARAVDRGALQGEELKSGASPHVKSGVD